MPSSFSAPSLSTPSFSLPPGAAAGRSIPPAPTSAPALEGLARRYAAMPRADAETLIDQQVGIAIREWRVADATFWQRVKFRSRMIRAATALRRDPHEGT